MRHATAELVSSLVIASPFSGRGMARLRSTHVDTAECIAGCAPCLPAGGHELRERSRRPNCRARRQLADVSDLRKHNQTRPGATGHNQEGTLSMGLLAKLRERLGSLTGDGSHNGGPGDSRGGLGGDGAEHHGAPQGRAGSWSRPGARDNDSERDPDEVAVERYRYMLRTAPPETVEQAHTEAFAKLTPEQRREVLDELNNAVPASERTTSEDPQSLARMATRAEMHQPGTMERALSGDRGGMGGGMGMGGMIAGSLLAGVAGAFIGSAVADAFLGDELAGAADMAGAGDMAGAADMAGVDLGVDPGAEMGDLGGMDDSDI